MVTMTCICGSSTQQFPLLTEKDFKDGWEQPCCKVDKIIEGGKVIEPAQTKPLLEQFLDGTGLRNRNRNGIWVSSRAIYWNYRIWLKMRGFDHLIPTVTRFGRDMKKLCVGRRRSQGKFYVLEKQI